jgi:hypothetical protein
VSKLIKIFIFLFFVFFNINYSFAINNKSKQSDCLIYVILNLHCHKESQIKICDIIHFLKQKHKNNFKVIGVEGSFGLIKTDPLSSIKSKVAKNAMINYMLDRGELNGAELYTIKYPGQVKLYGVEDKMYYEKNFNQLCKSFIQEKNIEDKFVELKKSIQRGKDVLYIDELKEFENIVSMYKQNKISLRQYVNYLEKFLKDNRIKYQLTDNVKLLKKTFELEKNIDLNQVQREANYFVRRLDNMIPDSQRKELVKIFKDNKDSYYITLKRILDKNKISYLEYENLNSYFEYLEYKERIDNINLLSELDELRFKIEDKLVIGNDAKKVLMCDRYTDILNKYIHNEASFRETQIWEAKRTEYYKSANEIIPKLRYKNIFTDIQKYLIDAEENMKGFYKLANKRNEIMVNNMVSRLKEENSSVGVMVVGGYHSEGIAQILRSKGIAYKVLIPKISTKYDKNIYKKRLEEQKNIFE